MASSSSPPPPGSSPVASPRSNTVLTPSRKVQALLAQFEDSDSDAAPKSPVPRVSVPDPTKSMVTDHDAEDITTRTNVDPLLDESDDELVLPTAPRSRIAARLEGKADVGNTSEQNDAIQKDTPSISQGEASASDPVAVQPRRRLLTKRRSSPVQQEQPRHSKSRSPSPMFFSSPDRPATGPDPDASDSDMELDGSKAGNAKFLALVEKHRKQRLEREAAEEAKKAARLERLQAEDASTRLQRGSSPADGTDEESDVSEDGKTKRLSTQARPARKASKKAQEELKRETQRMSRNMQLAHQARTKKKITKDSFLARFNIRLPGSSSPTTGAESDGHHAASSDVEATKTRDTPPTSPLQEPTGSDVEKTSSALLEAPPLPVAGDSDAALGFDEIMSASKDKGKGRAISEEPPVEQTPAFPVLGMAQTEREDNPKAFVKPFAQPPSTKPIKATKSELIKASIAKASKPAGDDDLDVDLEIVTNRGDKKKYAAFERLPKQKAKETQSHLTLRTLAHLHDDSSKRKTLNFAEVLASLRKAARAQALEERRVKIEELRARGIDVQTSEDRERELQAVEDLLDKARQEAVEIQKREKAAAKKDGTYAKDGLDDEDSDDSAEYVDELDGAEDDETLASEDEEEDGEDGEVEDEGDAGDNMIEDQAAEDDSDEQPSGEEAEEDAELQDPAEADDVDDTGNQSTRLPRLARKSRIVSDDDEDEENAKEARVAESPQLPRQAKTPQSLSRSARKQIPGLHMSDDLPIGLTQAFAATMADSQSQATQEQESLRLTMDLPSPNIAMLPRLNRHDSIDVISDSQPSASQTQPLNINLSYTQSQTVPESPSLARVGGPQFTPSQAQFEPTQDGGYQFSPFAGNRFATETPRQQGLGLQGTAEDASALADAQDSPVLQRRARLMRGRVGGTVESDDEEEDANQAKTSVFEVMKRAAKKKATDAFDKTTSHARNIVDEAAEESDDEYAGLGGVSDEDPNEEENEDDRRMIDEDTQVGVGDAAKLAKLYADRERAQDEADVSKLLKDITTGGLRRKRGNDDLDLSDEEDLAARRREAKRREFAKMRRELLKDEAVGKIAADKKKEAFLKSIEDRRVSDDDGDYDDFDEPQSQLDAESQEQSGTDDKENPAAVAGRPTKALTNAKPARLNQLLPAVAGSGRHLNRRPATLAEIRESVSFLVEEPDSQAAVVDLGLSDSEDEPEAYVDLDRHLREAEADENADDGEDLGDFIVDDDGQADLDDAAFKKPDAPQLEARASFSERRTKERPNVVNRRSMMRQASSSSSSSGGKLAFYGGSISASASFSKVPSLLRRATTNSSLGSMVGRNEKVSATGVVTSRTERGKASEEKEFVRKGNGGSRNAVNYRPTMKEEKMSARAGVTKKGQAKSNKGGGGGGRFLDGLFRGDSWT